MVIYTVRHSVFTKSRGGLCDHMVVGYTMQSVPITTKVVSSNPAHGEMHNSIQHYVLKFVNDLRQVSGFLRILRFPQAIKLTATI